MIKEKDVEYTIPDFPKDFWNYAVNPISGYIVDTKGAGLKRPPTTNGYDNRQRRKASRSSTNKKGDKLTK